MRLQEAHEQWTRILAPAYKCFEEKKSKTAKLMREALLSQMAVILRAYDFDWSRSQNTELAKMKYPSSRLD